MPQIHHVLLWLLSWHSIHHLRGPFNGPHLVEVGWFNLLTTLRLLVPPSTRAWKRLTAIRRQTLSAIAMPWASQALNRPTYKNEKHNLIHLEKGVKKVHSWFFSSVSEALCGSQQKDPRPAVSIHPIWAVWHNSKAWSHRPGSVHVLVDLVSACSSILAGARGWDIIVSADKKDYRTTFFVYLHTTEYRYPLSSLAIVDRHTHHCCPAFFITSTVHCHWPTWQMQRSSSRCLQLRPTVAHTVPGHPILSCKLFGHQGTIPQIPSHKSRS